MPKSRVKASALTGLSCTSSPMKALLVVEDVHWAGEATWSSAVPQLRSAATGGLGGQQQAGGGTSGTAAAALSAVTTAGATRAGPRPGAVCRPGVSSSCRLASARVSRRHLVGMIAARPRAARFSPGPGRGSGSALSLPAECDFGGLLDVALEGGRPGACRRWHALLVIVVDDDGLAVPVWAGVGEGLEPDDSAVVAPRGAAG